ncbi:hypothetical protein K488DRAFT_86639 [Vararia minispora EC-137]|uniref:Uncharacterized protein n=1 Tax=Vararia minispora EC-137 TaxID=1314806 RepID=A0ACB8QIQ7_9AGAM|nr:hypothetical protein K488DRAFT_86639 [Vararia minispora EC-137]
MSSPQAMPTAIVLNLTSTYGALLIGSYLSFMLWGINAMQIYLYCWNYQADSRLLQISVALAMIFDTLNKYFNVATSWTVLIQRWGDLAALEVNYG